MRVLVNGDRESSEIMAGLSHGSRDSCGISTGRSAEVPDSAVIPISEDPNVCAVFRGAGARPRSGSITITQTSHQVLPPTY